MAVAARASPGASPAALVRQRPWPSDSRIGARCRAGGPPPPAVRPIAAAWPKPGVGAPRPQNLDNSRCACRRGLWRVQSGSPASRSSGNRSPTPGRSAGPDRWESSEGRRLTSNAGPADAERLHLTRRSPCVTRCRSRRARRPEVQELSSCRKKGRARSFDRKGSRHRHTC